VAADKSSVDLAAGRSSRYLRAVSVLFASTLLLVVLVLLFVEAQQAQIRRHLADNRNVHIIQVTYHSGESDVRSLNFSDLDTVVDAAQSSSKHRVSGVIYAALPFGISADNGESYFVEGFIGSDLSWLLGETVPSGDSVVSPGPQGSAVLQVPVITAQGGGFSADQYVDRPVVIHPPSSKVPLDVFAPRNSMSLAVDAETFSDIVSTSLGVSWAEFVDDHDAGADLSGISVVNSIFVHVDSLSDVVPAAEAIEAGGFDVSYALKAFDNLAGTASTATYVAIGIVVLTLIGGTTLILVNGRSYLRLARRDMGVLLHHGYKRSLIASRYRARILRVLVRAAVPATVLMLAGSVAVLGPHWWYAVPSVVVMGAVLATVYTVLGYWMLGRCLSVPVLSLLKHELEFS